MSWENLSEIEIREFKEAFALFNKEQDGFITQSDVKDMLNAIGSTPTDTELKELLDEFDDGGKEKKGLNFPAFLRLMSHLQPDTGGIEEENKEVFRMLSDNGMPFVCDHSRTGCRHFKWFRWWRDCNFAWHQRNCTKYG